MRFALFTGTATLGLLLAGTIDACTKPVPTKPPRIRVMCLRPATATAGAIYRVYYTNYSTFGSTKSTSCACALGVPPNNLIIQNVQGAALNDALSGGLLSDATGPLFPFQPSTTVPRAFAPRMQGLQLFGFLAAVTRPVPGERCVTWCFDVALTAQGNQARLEQLLGASVLGTSEADATGSRLIGHTFITKPGGGDACCQLYYKFDRGIGSTAINYGNCCAPTSGTLVNAGPAPGPWCPPIVAGGSLCGSANNASTDYTYCDTGWKTGFGCNFTVQFSCRQRFNPGTGLSYLFGGMGSFRCFTNGVAGTALWVRSYGGADLKMPTFSGMTFQQLAARKQGVCIALSVNGTTKTAQWYVDGAPNGPTQAASNVLVPASTSSFKIGKHTSNTSSSAYDIDEFRFCNYPASAQQVRRWCKPSPACASWGTPCGLWLDCNSSPIPGGKYSMCLLGPESVTPFAFFIGFKPNNGFDLGVLFPNLKGCLWATTPDIILTSATASNGIKKITLPLPASSAGVRFDAQALGLTPAGWLSSNTLTTKIENP